MSRAYQVTIAAVTLTLALSFCRARDNSLNRRTEDFEVVSEGSASGVTSTVLAPGETPAPLVTTAAPITDTSADTTTAFTILETQSATATQQPGTLADIIPKEPERPRQRPSPPPETSTQAPAPESVEPAPAEQETEETEEEPQPEPQPTEPAQPPGSR